MPMKGQKNCTEQSQIAQESGVNTQFSIWMSPGQVTMVMKAQVRSACSHAEAATLSAFSGAWHRDQQLGCLFRVAAKFAGYIAVAVLIYWGKYLPTWHRDSPLPCSAVHARTATFIEERSVLGAWMAVWEQLAP